MPRVPFNVQTSRINADFGRRSVPAQSVRINSQPLDAAFAGLSGAIRSTPRVKAEDFSGVIALGKGISDLGHAAVQLAQEEKQIDYQRTGLREQNRLNAARAEWEGIKATVDPSEYKAKAEELLSNTLSTADYGNLGEDEKALLSEHANHFADTIRIDAKYATVTGKQNQLNAEYSVSLKNAITAGNVPQVGEIIKQTAALNHWTPDRTNGAIVAAGREMFENKAQSADVEINNFLRLGDVSKATEVYLDVYGDVDPNDPVFGKRKVISKSNIVRAQEDQEYTNITLNSPFTFNKDITDKNEDGTYKNFPHWTPERREQWAQATEKRIQQVDNKAVADTIELLNSQSLANKSDPKEQTKQIMEDRNLTATSKAMLVDKYVQKLPVTPTEWKAMAVEINDTKLSDDPDMRAYQKTKFELRIRAMLPDERKGMQSLIDNKFNPDDPSTRAAAPVLSKLNDALKAGYLGAYREQYTPPSEGLSFYDKSFNALRLAGAASSGGMMALVTPAKKGTPTPGTPLSPTDQARIQAMPEKDRPKALVDNAVKEANAVKEFMRIREMVIDMDKNKHMTESQIWSAIQPELHKFSAGEVLKNSASTFGPDNTLIGPKPVDANAEATSIFNKLLK